MAILLAFVAAIFGGLVNSIGFWGCGALGINESLDFHLVPVLTAKWLLPRLLSSGAWGRLFLLPFWRDELLKKGLVLGIRPLLLMLFMVFPKLGATAPFFAVFFTLPWGISPGLFLEAVQSQAVRPPPAPGP